MPFLKDKSKLQSRSKKLENLTLKSGFRRSVFTVPGDRYIGEWKNNLKNEIGTLLTRTYRIYYDGQWQENFRHGFGIFATRQENKIFILNYRGNWKRGKECGLGGRHYPDGAYYLGSFKNGKRHGHGQMWFADGSFYDGNWRRDLRHGLGMLIRPDGNRYEGSWALDLKNGKGRFYHLDSGQMQEGVWKDDICVYSAMIDIPFRQSSIQYTTPYSICHNKLVSPKQVCQERELKTLTNHLQSCLKIESYN